MNVIALRHFNVGELRKTARRSAYWQMRHVFGALVPQPEHNELIGRPECAIKEHALCAVDRGQNLTSNCGDSREVNQRPSVGAIAYSEGDIVFRARGHPTLQVQRRL